MFACLRLRRFVFFNVGHVEDGLVSQQVEVPNNEALVIA